jgi:hypothetical protein
MGWRAKSRIAYTPGRPQAPATYLCRRKLLSELSAAFASIMGGRLSLAQARSATLTLASEAMAAAASLERNRPVKFLIKGLPDLALLGSCRNLFFLMSVKHWSLFGFDIYFLWWRLHRRNGVGPLVMPTVANFLKGVWKILRTSCVDSYMALQTK